jgi:hypothetical protein
VEVEREIYGRLPPLPASEQSLWELSSRINQRGFHIDRTFAEAARKIAEAAAPEIDQELAAITGGDVTSINQVARLLAWLQDHGCTLRKLDRGAIERQLERADDLPAAVLRVLELRLGGAQAAVKKNQRPACPRRRGRSYPRRLSFPRCGDRPLVRRRHSAAELEARHR